MNSKTLHALRIFGFCLAATSAGLLAQPTPTPMGDDSLMTSTGTEKVKHADSSFMKKAAKSGMEEVDISTVAQDKATDPQVKDFAQMMVTDHTTANGELTALAATKGVKLPEKDKSANKWSKSTSKTFDKDYINKMVSDHEEAVKLFQKESTDGKDSDTVAFAQKYLPKLQTHLQKAKDLKALLK